jgi:AcrR family transcriptional regulator
MTSSAPSGPARKPADAYHHGDLRAALVEAARQALETTAPEAITLKSLALRLGVSQPAPYRHFASREGLLAAVAADGFVRFGEALLTAARTAAPAARLEAAALAYLNFASANIGVYRLMFASSLLKGSQDAFLDQASQASFRFLLDALTGHVPPERVQVAAIRVWATLHGLAMLEAEGITEPPAGQPITPAQVVHDLIASLPN